jgi:hypothetical protein
MASMAAKCSTKEHTHGVGVLIKSHGGVLLLRRRICVE